MELNDIGEQHWNQQHDVQLNDIEEQLFGNVFH